MAYTKPFTAAQRLEAVKAYRSFRRNLKDLKHDYSPKSRSEREALSEYRNAIKAMELEISMPVDWINPRKLNLLEEAARKAMVEYMVKLMKRGY